MGRKGEKSLEQKALSSINKTNLVNFYPFHSLDLFMLSEALMDKHISRV
jgi:hypothetical protein